MENSNVKQPSVFLSLLRDLFVDPKMAFQIESLKTNVFFIFISVALGGIFTLWKSFKVQSIKNNFYESDNLNEFLSILNIPQVQWAVSYLGYFFFIGVLVFLCRTILKRQDAKVLVLGILSIGIIGLLLAVLTTVLMPFLPPVIVSAFVPVISIWMLVLAILAVKFTQDIAMTKAVLFFFIAALPTFFLFGLPGLFPCFLWLSVS